MKDIIVDDFQNSVSQSLIRHKSIIDIMTKIGESSSRINRALAKSVTNCGCIEINAHKQSLPEDASLDQIGNILSYQVDGKMCSNCREVLEEEIGTLLYYIAALSESLDINLFDIILKQYGKIQTLGKFSML
ncbi:DUF1573 domain-containing protein [Fonticella tunisiensis]|uniref:DUF1573 domain-containing protein n=1 Tax=Fonticella tunisiensis TaxID=1096341 RepID=A0A4R7KDX9_9CLOT|nr:DUF1573 domain-containing protein [Fonticella tunisiensis]TDT51253.1 hypothetical protein EDD71_12034 [Fonticella tunisiensis]